jgi:holo-[acyl-carrier protein] synthase
MLRDRRPSADVAVGGLKRAVLEATSQLLSDIDPVPIAVGVDVVDLVQFGHNYRIGGQRWLRKVFTPGEMAHANDRIEQLGVRFAAKEAVAKVLGTGFRDGISARNIEIITTPDGKPTVGLHNDAAKAALTRSIDLLMVSMSREGRCGVAVAMGLRLHRVSDAREANCD